MDAAVAVRVYHWKRHPGPCHVRVVWFVWGGVSPTAAVDTVLIMVAARRACATMD